MMLQYAGLDTRIDAGWPAYEEALKANHVNYRGSSMKARNHGFHNDTTPRYDEKAAKLAWSARSNSSIRICAAESAYDLAVLLEDPGERGAMLGEHEKPEDRDEYAGTESGGLHRDMEDQDIDEHRPDQGQRQRNISVG